MKKTKIKVHFMGIGGTGASAAAAIARACGFQISGCDIAKSKYFTELEKIKIEIGHNKKHLKSCDLLVISPAILKFDPQNQELKAAKKLRIPILTWQEFMGKFLQKGKRVIAVSGTHGKSTTTAMIGHVLEDADFEPTVEIGAVDLAWGRNYRVGNGEWFVCEADEYNKNFLNYQPEIAVITNIDFDHPDFFKNNEAVFESFVKFVNQNSNLKILILDPRQRGIKKFLAKIKNNSNFQIVNSLNLISKLNLPGEHNLNNANLAATVVKFLGISEKVIVESLYAFQALERRLEFKGFIGKTKIYDDFAHHPAEIEATVKTLKSQVPKTKICLIFQPHTYSRTRALFSDFVKVFKKSNLAKIIFTEIFASREKNSLGISSHDLAAAVGGQSIYISDIDGIVDWIDKNGLYFDVLVTVGAGDIGKVWEMAKLRVKLRHNEKI